MTSDITIPKIDTYQDYMEALWRHNQTILLAAVGKRIPIFGESHCFTCYKRFLSSGYAFYCSEDCQSIGEDREDNWRSA